MWIINWEVSFLLQLFSQTYVIHKIKRWKWILCKLLKLESRVKGWNYPEFRQYHEFNNTLFVKHSYSTLFIFNASSWEILVLNVYCFLWFTPKCKPLLDVLNQSNSVAQICWKFPHVLIWWRIIDRSDKVVFVRLSLCKLQRWWVSKPQMDTKHMERASEQFSRLKFFHIFNEKMMQDKDYCLFSYLGCNSCTIL